MRPVGPAAVRHDEREWARSEAPSGGGLFKAKQPGTKPGCLALKSVR